MGRGIRVPAGVRAECLESELTPGRLNSERIEKLRPDNPKRALLHDLAGGMKVQLPEGFMTNGHMPRTDRRPIYETMASAVNKMLGALVEVAQQHVPNLHLCKSHWTVTNGKPSGRPLGDLSNVWPPQRRITARSNIRPLTI
jgi:hypothetical protein